MSIKKSRTYAEALLELDPSLIPALKSFSEVFTEKKIMDFFCARTISLKSKKNLMRSVLKFAPPELKNFFFILLDKGAFSLLPEIVSKGLAQADEKKGLHRGLLFSSHPLPDSEVRQIEETLMKFFNKKIELRQKEDKKLVGGFSIEVGGYRFNNTVGQDLKRFQN